MLPQQNSSQVNNQVGARSSQLQSDCAYDDDFETYTSQALYTKQTQHIEQQITNIRSDMAIPKESRFSFCQDDNEQVLTQQQQFRILQHGPKNAEVQQQQHDEQQTNIQEHNHSVASQLKQIILHLQEDLSESQKYINELENNNKELKMEREQQQNLYIKTLSQSDEAYNKIESDQVQDEYFEAYISQKFSALSEAIQMNQWKKVESEIMMKKSSTQVLITQQDNPDNNEIQQNQLKSNKTEYQHEIASGYYKIISILQEKLIQSEKQFTELEQNYKQLKTKEAQLLSQYIATFQQNEEAQREVRNHYSILKKFAQNQAQVINQYEEQIEQHKIQCMQLENQLENYEQQHQNLEQDRNQLQEQIRQHNLNIPQLQKQLNDQKLKHQSQEELINQQKEIIRQSKIHISQLQNQLQKYDSNHYNNQQIIQQTQRHFEAQIIQLENQLMNYERKLKLSQIILSRTIKENQLRDLERNCAWDESTLSFKVPSFVIQNQNIIFCDQKDLYKQNHNHISLPGIQVSTQQNDMQLNAKIQNSKNRYQTEQNDDTHSNMYLEKQPSCDIPQSIRSQAGSRALILPSLQISCLQERDRLVSANINNDQSFQTVRYSPNKYHQDTGPMVNNCFSNQKLQTKPPISFKQKRKT